MAKKTISIIICALLCVASCACFMACDRDEEGGGTQTQLHDSTKWFTEEELKAKGLEGLTAPTKKRFLRTRKRILRILMRIITESLGKRESKNTT